MFETNLLERLWDNLEEQCVRQRQTGVRIRRILPESGRNLYLGFCWPASQRMFLLQIPKKLTRDFVAFPSLRGVELVITTYPHDEPNHGTIAVVLKENRFAAVFTHLVHDLATHIGVQASDADAVRSLLSRIESWRRFLEAHADGLGTNAQLGLYGELYFLSRYVLPQTGAVGVMTWAGASKAAQDFHFPKFAVEAKSTASVNPQTLIIANENQLDFAAFGSLFLYHASFDRQHVGHKTLPSIVESIRSYLSGSIGALNVFDETLLEAGYSDSHENLYLSPSYQLMKEDVYRVSLGFPSLTKQNLPSGVFDVSYKINLSDCRPFVTNLAEVIGMISESRESGC